MRAMPMAYSQLCGAARDYVEVIQKVSDGTVEICAPQHWARDNSDLFCQEQRAPRPRSNPEDNVMGALDHGPRLRRLVSGLVEDQFRPRRH